MQAETNSQNRGLVTVVFELLAANWLTLVLLVVLAVVLVRDRIPAWQRARAMEGRPAPDFVLNDLAGREVRLSDYRGKFVLLNFWATWCLPCRLELPHLKALHAELPADRFVLLSVTAERPGYIQAFADKYELDYPILIDPREESLLKYNVQQYPTLVWIDPEGRITQVSTGLDFFLRWKARYRVTGSLL